MCGFEEEGLSGLVRGDECGYGRYDEGEEGVLGEAEAEGFCAAAMRRSRRACIITISQSSALVLATRHMSERVGVIWQKKRQEGRD